jgi:hypothetical protein
MSTHRDLNHQTDAKAPAHQGLRHAILDLMAEV